MELTRRAFQAFNDRDLDTVLAGLHDEVEAFPRLAAVEGGYRGHDGVRRWWAQLLGGFPDVHVEILEVRDLGEFIVLALRLRGRGAESDTPHQRGRSPRSRAAAGVADVAGERGGSSCSVGGPQTGSW